MGTVPGARMCAVGGSMKIMDLKCAVIGRNPVVRVVTDKGISGYGEVEASKTYLKPYILDFAPALLS